MGIGLVGHWEVTEGGKAGGYKTGFGGTVSTATVLRLGTTGPVGNLESK